VLQVARVEISQVGTGPLGGPAAGQPGRETTPALGAGTSARGRYRSGAGEETVIRTIVCIMRREPGGAKYGLELPFAGPRKKALQRSGEARAKLLIYGIHR
jgi:hypothetical protein